jgi:hypothetical protein
MDSDFPYKKRVTPDNLVGYSETAKAAQIQKVFEDAYRTPQSIIILDDIERLIGVCSCVCVRVCVFVCLSAALPAPLSRAV